MNATTTMKTAERLFEDPEVTGAIDTLVKALERHQGHITGISEGDPELSEVYKKTLEEFGKSRGAGTFFPYLSSGIGNGPYVELGDGSVKLDFITGIGVHYFGHSHPSVIRAGIKAGMLDTVMQGNLQQTYHTPILCDKLLNLARKNESKLEHCFVSTSGVMANENAIKMAFGKNQPASRVLAFERCFAGRTLALSCVTDKAAYRDGLPQTLGVDYIPFYDPKDPKGSTKKAVDTLKKYIKRYPKQHAAMIYELMQGEGGFYPGSKEFHRALMTVCKDNEIANISDEVQGFARTSEPYMFQYYGLDDLVDIVCIGKNSQVCATLFTDEYTPKPGLVAQTFTASTSAILSCLAILEEFEVGNYFGQDGKIMKMGNYFRKRLIDLEKKHPDLIQGPYGDAAMVGFTPLGGEVKPVIQFVKDLYRNGLMTFGAGASPMRVRFLLPVLAMEEAHIDEAIDIIEKTITSY